MTEENKTEENPPIAEVLIATGMNLAREQELKLGELIGHFEIAKIEVYNRITRSAVAAQQSAESSEAPAEISEQSEGDDKEETTVSFEAEAEGKDEK